MTEPRYTLSVLMPIPAAHFSCQFPNEKPEHLVREIQVQPCQDLNSHASHPPLSACYGCTWLLEMTLGWIARNPKVVSRVRNVNHVKGDKKTAWETAAQRSKYKTENLPARTYFTTTSEDTKDGQRT
jgi:hypothetical protein